MDIVDTSERSFLVDNSAGTYTATVKTSAGTGIPVLAGTKVWLLCDGANVIQTVSVPLTIIDSIADMLLLDPLIYPNVNILGYTTANDGGGGLFNYDATKDKATANAGTIIDPSVSLALQGTGVV
jgi:hypothetical protein